MGIHYINPKKLKITRGQPRVDGKATHTDFMSPSILLYAPRAGGSLELVGVENLVFLNAWKAAGNLAPSMFAGRVWDTMADNSNTPEDEAHRFEPHHDQHVYFTKIANAKNQLRPFNPNVTCKYHKSAHQAGDAKINPTTWTTIGGGLRTAVFLSAPIAVIAISRE